MCTMMQTIYVHSRENEQIDSSEVYFMHNFIS